MPIPEKFIYCIYKGNEEQRKSVLINLHHFLRTYESRDQIMATFTNFVPYMSQSQREIACSSLIPRLSEISFESVNKLQLLVIGEYDKEDRGFIVDWDKVILQSF